MTDNICKLGDNLQEMSPSIFWEKIRKILGQAETFSVDPDQTLQNAASDLGLHYFPHRNANAKSTKDAA